MTESKGVEQWYFKERNELLANTKHNEPKGEILFRKNYTSFTLQLCNRLAVHPIISCASLLMMQRVLLRWHSSYDNVPAVSDLSATMVFLGCKVEEAPHHLNQVLSHVLALKDQQETSKEQSSEKGKLEEGEENDEISGMKERIFELERKVLVLLCFDFTVDNPYRHISRFFKSMALPKDGANKPDKKKEKEMIEKANRWKQAAIERMNSSFYSLAHLEFSERHIAAACVMFSRSEDDPILEDDWINPFRLESILVVTRINNSIDKDLGWLEDEVKK
jgi:hypothetical protein